MPGSLEIAAAISFLFASVIELVECAHRREGTNVLQRARRSICEFVLKVRKSRHLGGDLVNALDQGLSICPENQQIFSHGFIEFGPEKALLDRSIAESFAPIRRISPAVDVLGLIVESEGDQTVCAPIPGTRHEPSDR